LAFYTRAELVLENLALRQQLTNHALAPPDSKPSPMALDKALFERTSF
jgi:hypothetical protein